MKLKLLALASACCLLGWSSTAAVAQPYPNKPIRMIVTAPAGGTADFLARLVAERMTKELKQSVVIDNRGGASGMLGADMVAKAPADGYTLLLTEGASLAINSSVRNDMPFDLKKDLMPLSLVATTPSILVANPSFKANTLKELVTAAKEAPGKYSYASPGVGTPHHLAAVMFAQLAGIELNHVPYKGGGAMVTDVVAGHVPLLITGTLSPLSFVKSGKLKALAIGSPERNALLPEVPTFAESGFADFRSEVFFGMFLPAKTPPEIAAQLAHAVEAAAKDETIRKKLEEQALVVYGTEPEQLKAHFDKESNRWLKVINDAKIKIE